MICSKCSAPAPNNLISFNNSTWTCPSCESVKLQEELHKLYKIGQPARYLYISDLSNNLDKVSSYFTESVSMENPLCTITLTSPEGCPHLKGHFDGVYIDRGCVTEADLRCVLLTNDGYVKWVEGTSQIIDS